MLPGSARVALVNSSTRSIQSSANLGRTDCLTTMKITPASFLTLWSQADVEDRLVQGVDIDRLQCLEQLLVRNAGEEPVDGPLIIRDVSLEPFGEAHVLKALAVESALLLGQVREVLGEDGRQSWVVTLPYLGPGGSSRFAVLREAGERPDLHQRLFRAQRT